jgi:hypothetical protein
LLVIASGARQSSFSFELDCFFAALAKTDVFA